MAIDHVAEVILIMVQVILRLLFLLLATLFLNNQKYWAICVAMTIVGVN